MSFLAWCEIQETTQGRSKFSRQNKLCQNYVKTAFSVQSSKLLFTVCVVLVGQTFLVCT